MACKVTKNKDGHVTGAVAPNGKPSKLFEKLVRATGNVDAAYSVYAKMHEKAFKDKYGMNWESDTSSESQFTDENGEPVLIPGNGYYYTFGPKGEVIELRDAKITDQNNHVDFSYGIEKDAVSTVISWVNDIRNARPEFFKGKDGADKTSQLFNANERYPKGILANNLLDQSFDQELEAEQVQELFRIYKEDGKNAMIAQLPEGVNFTDGVGDLFFKMYDEWNDIVDPVTKNITRAGWRSKVQDELSAYGLKLKDGDELQALVDDDYVRIHDVSRLQENPKDKMSAVVKNFLTDIRSNDALLESKIAEYIKKENITDAQFDELVANEQAPAWYYQLGPNKIGYYSALPLDLVYSEISESTVGQVSFAGMLQELQYRTNFKPSLIPVLERLKTLNSQQQAAFFSNFNNSYKSFLQFKSNRITTPGPDGRPVTTVTTEMFNSNESDTARRYRTLYKRQSREVDVPNPRAPYKEYVTEDGTGVLLTKKEVRAGIADAWKRIEAVNSISAELTDDAVDALGEFLWLSGMQYADTLEGTQSALREYFEKGDAVGTKGLTLFKQFVFAAGGKPGDSFIHLKEDLLNDRDIYDQRGGAIHKIASLAPLFDGKAFGSFISGTGKQYYPINEPTAIDEFKLLLQTEEFNKAVEQMRKDPLYKPGDDINNQSILLRILHTSTLARNSFDVEVMDSYKSSNEGTATNDYGNQSDKTSLIVRLNAYASNANKTFTKIALPTQADRKRLDFVTVPRLDALTKKSSKISNVRIQKREILKGLIIQDFARIAQAKAQIRKAAELNDSSQLIEGYHYKEGSNPFSMDKGEEKGSAFTMPQIVGLEDIVVNQETGQTLSDLLQKHLDRKEGFANSNMDKLVGQLIEEQVDKLEAKLEEYVEEVNDTIKEFDINIKESVESRESTKEDFIENFVFNDFVYRIEFAKMFRGGFSFSKNGADFYKRAGLLNTPGKKLLIKGDTQGPNTNPDYGMMPRYGEITIKDFDFVDKETANEIADNIAANLQAQGLDAKTANATADNYRSLNKTDGQGVISVEMYRGIMMGIGEWDMVLDEQAYNNEKAGKGFVDNEGNPRSLRPIKPYHEELIARDVHGMTTMAPAMDKNSYMPLTRDLADQFPELKKIHDRFEKGDVQVANTNSATKGARVNVQDLTTIENLDEVQPTMYDSRKLRLPQIMPKKKQKEITLSKQIRKNIMSNIKRNGSYAGPWGQMTGTDLFNLFQNTVAENISEDTANLDNELGLSALKKETPGTEAYANAKLAHLQKLKSILIEQVKDKDLPQNYIKALNIVPNGNFDFRYEVPMAFPNYQGKFEQIFFSLFNNNIFVQKIKGKELVQIAEMGGHIVDNELGMYDGTSPAQVRIKASMLGIKPGTPIEDVDSALLDSIAYRIPNQGKNSMLPMTVVGFLPESYDKAIMVPGGITVQMGSDFDIDKLYIIQAETEMVKPSDEVLEADNIQMTNKWENWISTPQYSPKAGKNVVRADIENFDPVKSKIEFANANDIKYNKKTDSFSIGREDTLQRVRPDYSKPASEMTRKERNTILYDIMESVLKSPLHLEEVITPLDGDRLQNTANDIRETTGTTKNVDYNNPLAEITMEARNKAGVALRGLWANQLAGRNTAQAGNMSVDSEFAPIIVYNGNPIRFTEIGREREFKDGAVTVREYVPGEGFVGPYTDYSISQYLTLAVDAAKDPIQVDINDNTFTVPVAGLMISVGVPVEEVVYFLAQPAIKEAIKDAKLNDRTLGGLLTSIGKVYEKIKKDNKISIKALKNMTMTTPMDASELRDISGDNPTKQLNYLVNFKQLFLAGRSLQTVYKLITPDNVSNLNEISSLTAWLDTETEYMGKESNIIKGAEDFVHANKDGIAEVYPMARAFRGIMDTMMDAAKQAGFINNSAAFTAVKKKFKDATNKFSLTSEQHKFLDRVLFLKIMAGPESPFNKAGKDANGDPIPGALHGMVNYSYTNPNNNIATRLQGLREQFPLLNANPFIKALEPGTNNNKAGQKVFTVKFDNSFDLSAHDKNLMGNALLDIIQSPEKFVAPLSKEATEAEKEQYKKDLQRIQNFGKELVYNQLATTGFKPGGYADMIPIEVFTTRLMFKDKKGPTPVEYFSDVAATNLIDANYFGVNTVADIVANYGLAKPGGTPLLPTVRYKKVVKRLGTADEFSINQKQAQDLGIYNDTLGYAEYFVTYPPGGVDPITFVFTGDGYKKLQQQGSGPVHEMAVPLRESIINKGTNATAVPGPTKVHAKPASEVKNKDDNSLNQPEKICKI